jgi:glycogen debranching enzyme GlgX
LRALWPGEPFPLGPSWDGEGTNFSLFSEHADRVELCLFDAADREERIELRQRTALNWHGYLPGVGPGQRYGYRVHGLWAPEQGHRFNPHKLLIDPYAKAIEGPIAWERGRPLAYATGDDTVIDESDDAAAIPKCVVIDESFEWEGDALLRRPWHETVIYEVHVKGFTKTMPGVRQDLRGTYAGLASEAAVSYLTALGVTAVELMPLADFPGRWGWGYDGVLPFAPEGTYGRPEDVKRFVEACHARGLAVLVDVVYNHFGPEGNYLHRTAPDFTSPRHRTPWGEGINFDGPRSAVVREWVVHNALYWLEEFHADGLRLDAVHAIADDSRPHILEEVAAAVDAAQLGRSVHLVLENEANAARLLDPSARPHYRAQWNDDVHHVLHVLLTGERDGYYADYHPALPMAPRPTTIASKE